MKKTYLLGMLMLFCVTAISQYVNIPDTNFKNALLNYNKAVIDTNNDGEISFTEAESLKKLDVGKKKITDLIGI